MALGNTTVARLQAVLDADTSQFDRKMKTSQTATQKFGGVAKTALIGGVAAGITAVGVAAKIGWDEYNQGAKVAAQTNAVIKSTGGVANVTAKHLEDLGGSLMRISGVDDELIKSGENVLLTFTHVRNEAGKGNAIFDRTTKLALDLSTALGTDLQSANIQLGKALNGSATGVSALQRSGVSFTDSQKETIARLFEEGNALKAQKIILKEVATEFGGSAKAAGETFGGQINIARERLNNFLGDMVEKAIPYIQQFIKWIGPYFSRAVEATREVIEELRKRFVALGAILQRHRETVDRVITALRFLAKAVIFVLEWYIKFQIGVIKVWLKVLDVVLTATDKIIAAVSQVIDWTKRLWDWFGRIWQKAKDTWGKVHDKIVDVKDALDDALQPIKDFWNAIKDGIDKVLGPLKAVVGFFERLGGGSGGGPGQTGGRFGSDGLVGVLNGLVVGGPSAANPGGLQPQILDDLGLAQSFGLSLQSGYRPGSITSSGNVSLHASGRAIDVGGSESAMRRFFLFEAARGAATGLAEVIHSPYWWHPSSGIGRITDSKIMADHYSHVHVGTYDKGGYLRPGWNLAYNGTGRPEPVGGGVTVNIGGSVIAERDLRSLIARLETEHRRRGGR